MTDQIPDVINGHLADLAAETSIAIVECWLHNDRDIQINRLLDYVYGEHGREGLFVLLVTMVGTAFTASPADVDVSPEADDMAERHLLGVIAFKDAVLAGNFPLAWEVFGLWVPVYEGPAPESTGIFVTLIIALTMSHHHGVMP